MTLDPTVTAMGWLVAVPIGALILGLLFGTMLERRRMFRRLAAFGPDPCDLPELPPPPPALDPIPPEAPAVRRRGFELLGLALVGAVAVLGGIGAGVAMSWHAVTLPIAP